MRTLRFIDMRMNILDNLRSLSDRDHQDKCWTKHLSDDSFDEVVHCLFDDSGFERNARSAIGDILFDESEADQIQSVIDLIDRLFEKYGKSLSDEEYIETPRMAGDHGKCSKRFRGYETQLHTIHGFCYER